MSTSPLSRKITRKNSVQPNEFGRTAGVIFLLCLLGFCPGASGKIITHLPLGGPQAYLKNAARAFEQMHPGVEIHFAVPGGNAGAITSAQAADVFPLVSFADIDFLVLVTMAQDLRIFMRTDRTFSWDAFLPATSSLMSTPDLPDREGKVWGLPWGLEADALLVNLMLRDQAGLAYPKDGWDWDAFRAAEGKMTRVDPGNPTGGTYGFMGHPVDSRLLDFIYQAGGEPFDGWLDPRAGRFSTRAAQTGLAFVAERYRKNHLAPGLAMTQGHAGMQITNALNWGFIATRQGIAWQADFAMLPKGPVHGGGQVWVYAWAINAQSGVQREAWECIKFLTTDPRVAIGQMAEMGKASPLRSTIDRLVEVWPRPLPHQGIWTAVLSHPHNVPAPIARNKSQVQGLIARAVRGIALGGTRSIRQQRSWIGNWRRCWPRRQRLQQAEGESGTADCT